MPKNKTTNRQNETNMAGEKQYKISTRINALHPDETYIS
jgi:hypothetical protein